MVGITGAVVTVAPPVGQDFSEHKKIKVMVKEKDPQQPIQDYVRKVRLKVRVNTQNK